MKTLFLSHSHSESSTAIAVAHWLEEIFVDQIDVICTSEPEHHIRPGHMLTSGILEKMRSSAVVLVLVTPESLAHPWVYYEMGAAYALEKPFIPCVTRGTALANLPPQAMEYQGANLRSVEDLRKLVRALSNYLQLTPPPSDYIRMKTLEGAERFA